MPERDFMLERVLRDIEQSIGDTALSDIITGATTVRGSDPLFPVDERRNERGAVVQKPNTGVTLRTYAAIQIMASIASDPAYDCGPVEAAETAVSWADALIKRLNK